ncbi:MAG: phenylalanine--tRNA ligase subunit alpha [Candidatus Dadabacteria bacterium]|nr:MAG: phenylalanine--tRNA ligase subunit alpha [Candidatus Dadabacteria bacterium]
MNEALHKLNAILEGYKEKISSVKSEKALKELESEIFGKNGALKQVMKLLGSLPAESRKEVGKKANEVSAYLKSAISLKLEELQKLAEMEESFDMTLPPLPARRGALHPITYVTKELNRAFLSLGFEVYEGPEIPSEGASFDNLNFPDDHPARESMDTYWLKGSEQASGFKKLCLRPHLTGASVRYMLSHKPPFRFVYPGRVYRNEAVDASHERAFNQYEALIVDRDVPFSSGRILVNTILECVFGKPVPTRMRAGFFPFVEPGFEIDMQCLVCKGKGCSICKRTGWVEMMPGGPPHPAVMRAGGIDPERWSGFYINIGLDRLVMMKFGITDIRLFRSGDLRFLKQFV